MSWIHTLPTALLPWNETIGSVAALLTTAAFVPQVWLTLRSRDVSGISLGMYLVFTTGITLWLLYGWVLGSLPLIAANTVTLALASAILAMKLWFSRQAAPAAGQRQ